MVRRKKVKKQRREKVLDKIEYVGLMCNEHESKRYLLVKKMGGAD